MDYFDSWFENTALIKTGQPWWQEHKTVHHVESTVRQNRLTGAVLVIFLFSVGAHLVKCSNPPGRVFPPVSHMGKVSHRQA